MSVSENEPVSAIRNIGPASVDLFARAGIHSAQEVRDLGPDATYRKLISAGTRPHFIGYYALVMGLQGRPWNDCKGAEKEALRLRFDAIKDSTQAAPLAGIEKILDDIGVRAKK